MPSNNSSPHRLLFIIANLGGGGAERALVNLINHLDRTRFQPHLALFQKEGVFLEALAPDVPVHEIQPRDLGLLHRSWVRVRAIKRLCNTLHPALVMSVLWQVNIVTLLAHALLNLDCPVVTNEQNTLTRGARNIWQRKWLFWPLAHRVYKRAAKVITISSGIASELQDALSLPPSKFQVINNPTLVDDIQNQAHLPSASLPDEHSRLIAVGRLAKQKNYPLLLRATGRVLKEENVHLYILGEGPERPNLEELIRTLGLERFVDLLGFQPNPFAYMGQADVFVLSSNFEGFGNVIAEAMALGVPVIATDCPYGPREILADGKYGLLVPPGDESALVEAILSLLRDPDARHQLAVEARKRAEDFSTERIVPQYEQLFVNLIAN